MNNDTFWNDFKEEQLKPVFNKDRKLSDIKVAKEIKRCNTIDIRRSMPNESSPYLNENNVNVVSLKTLNIVTKLLRNKVERQINSFNETYAGKVKYVYHRQIPGYGPKKVKIFPFDYDKKELPVFLDIDCFSIDKIMIWFKVENGNLECRYESFNNDTYPTTMFLRAEKEILEIIDFYNTIESFNEKKEGVKSVNSDFKLDIDYYGTTIKVPDFNNNYDSLSFRDKYHERLSNEKLSEIGFDENNFLDKIYVNIEDCPKWLISTLNSARKNEIKEKQKEEKQNKMRAKVRRFFK